jgi:hypothetical protein
LPLNSEDCAASPKKRQPLPAGALDLDKVAGAEVGEAGGIEGVHRGGAGVARRGTQVEVERLNALLVPHPAEGMAAWPVNRRLRNVKNNNPG